MHNRDDLHARASACTATNTMSYVGHGSYGRVQTAPKVRVCAAVLRAWDVPSRMSTGAKFTPRNTATTNCRSTKTTIMTVHVNTIMQAAPSQRRITFRSVRQVISCCFTPRNYFSLSESDGGLISSSNRVHGPRNCSQEGSRTASRFAIQVDRDGRSNYSQLGSRPSPANKPCPRRGDSRRSSGLTRRRSASDGCRKGQWAGADPGFQRRGCVLKTRYIHKKTWTFYMKRSEKEWQEWQFQLWACLSQY